jgi:hypothetical protein
MRVGTLIKELCTALEGMDSATAAEIHQAAFPELDVNSVRTYCSRSVGLGFATVDRSTYPMRFAIAEGWQRYKTKKPQPAKQQRPVYARPANPLFTAWSAAA